MSGCHSIPVTGIRGFYLDGPSGAGGIRRSRWPHGRAAGRDDAQAARAYVQAVRLAAPRTATPVALLPGGGGLTGAWYESGLDGSLERQRAHAVAPGHKPGHRPDPAALARGPVGAVPARAARLLLARPGPA